MFRSGPSLVFFANDEGWVGLTWNLPPTEPSIHDEEVCSQFIFQLTPYNVFFTSGYIFANLHV